MRALPTTSLKRHVRTAAALSGRPALGLGLRVAVATGVPLFLRPWLAPAVGAFAPFAGYSTAQIDNGGAYAERAKMMAMFTLGALVAVIVGTFASLDPVVSIVVVTLGTTACAFGHALGGTAPVIANSIAVQLIVASVLPIGLANLGLSLVGFALGAGWAMFLALGVWPVRVYRPGRHALESVLAALADYTDEMATWSTVATLEPPARVSREGLVARHRDLRDRIEYARATLVATRRGRGAETARGSKLLAALHAADHVFEALVALEELLDAGIPEAEAPALRDALATIGRALRASAAQVLVEGAAPATAPRWDAPRGARRPAVAHALLLLARVEDERRIAARMIDGLDDDTEPVIDPDAPAPPAPPSVRDRLVAALDRDSPVLRHVLRVFLCIGAASCVAAAMHLEHGYWLTITTFILLQPNRGATTTRAIQRGIGTVVGVLIAAGVALVVHDAWLVTAIITVFAGLGACVVRLNYALFAMFMTPTFVLLAESSTQDYSLGWTRVVFTLIGGTIAFLASALLWPSREHDRFDDQIADALDAAAAHLGAIRTAVATDAAAPDPAIAGARRALALAIGRAALALDRVVADGAPLEVLEPRMAMASSARRLAGAVTALGTARAVVDFSPHAAAIVGYARACEARLVELGHAVRFDQRPPAWTLDTPAVADPAIAARLDRIALQVRAIADAATRAAP